MLVRGGRSTVSRLYSSDQIESIAVEAVDSLLGHLYLATRNRDDLFKPCEHPVAFLTVHPDHIQIPSYFDKGRALPKSDNHMVRNRVSNLELRHLLHATRSTTSLDCLTPKS